jgi:hypothetical protein
MHFREYFEDPPHYDTVHAYIFLLSSNHVSVRCGTARGGDGGRRIKIFFLGFSGRNHGKIVEVASPGGLV